jgi:hypothetical protein
VIPPYLTVQRLYCGGYAINHTRLCFVRRATTNGLAWFIVPIVGARPEDESVVWLTESGLEGAPFLRLRELRAAIDVYREVVPLPLKRLRRANLRRRSGRYELLGGTVVVTRMPWAIGRWQAKHIGCGHTIEFDRLQDVSEHFGEDDRCELCLPDGDAPMTEASLQAVVKSYYCDSEE